MPVRVRVLVRVRGRQRGVCVCVLTTAVSFSAFDLIIPLHIISRKNMRWMWLRLVAGIFLIMVEPVSGIRLINSYFEAEDALTMDERAQNDKARDDATNVHERNKETKKAAAAKLKAAKKAAKIAAKEANSMNAHGVGFKPLELFGVFCESEAAAEKELQKAKETNCVKEVEVTKKENAFHKKNADLLVRLSDYKSQKANVTEHVRNFALDRKKLNGAEMVEVAMAAFEDIPELILGLIFFAKGGLAESSDADISLFVTSMVVSIFHASKCFWTWHTLRSIIRESKLASDDTLGYAKNVKLWDGKLDTYRFGSTDGYFEIPPLENEIECLTDETNAIGKKLDRLKKKEEKRKAKIDLERALVDDEDRKITLEAEKIKLWSAAARSAIEEQKDAKKAKKKLEKIIESKQAYARKQDPYNRWRYHASYHSHRMVPVVSEVVRRHHDEVYGRSNAASKWVMLGNLPADLLYDLEVEFGNRFEAQDPEDDLWNSVTYDEGARTPEPTWEESTQTWVVPPEEGELLVPILSGKVKGPCGDCGLPVRETHERELDEDGTYYHVNARDCFTGTATTVENKTDMSMFAKSYWADSMLFGNANYDTKPFWDDQKKSWVQLGSTEGYSADDYWRQVHHEQRLDDWT